MKRIGITQRAEFIDTIGETRDALDTRWAQLLLKLTFLSCFEPKARPHSCLCKRIKIRWFFGNRRRRLLT